MQTFALHSAAFRCSLLLSIQCFNQITVCFKDFIWCAQEYHVTQAHLLCGDQSLTIQSLRCNSMYGVWEGSQHPASNPGRMIRQRGDHKSATEPGFARGKVLGSPGYCPLKEWLIQRRLTELVHESIKRVRFCCIVGRAMSLILYLYVTEC